MFIYYITAVYNQGLGNELPTKYFSNLVGRYLNLILTDAATGFEI